MLGDSSGLAENSSAVLVGPTDRLDGTGIGGSLALGSGSTKSSGERPVAIWCRMRWRNLLSVDLAANERRSHLDHLTGQDPPAHSPELESPPAMTRPDSSAARYWSSLMVS